MSNEYSNENNDNNEEKCNTFMLELHRILY